MTSSHRWGTVEAGMQMYICPMCSRALKISTIEPHPTHCRVDVVTYRCPVHDTLTSVVNRVEATGTDIAELLSMR
jgi:hypothetical protein